MSDQVTLDATALVDIVAEGKDGVAEGKEPLARFRMTGNTGAPMRLAGWKYPVVLDMEGVTIPSQKAPVRFQHDPHHGVGHTESIGVEGGKLVASGVISRGTAAAKEVRDSARNGFPWQASVGATADEVEFVKAGQRVQVNGMEYEGPINVARKSTVGELSFVDLGADPHTDALIANGRKIAAAKDDDGGDTGANPRDGAEATKQIIQRTKVERARQDGIRALTEEYSQIRGSDLNVIERITASALDENWTLEQTELALLRETRAKPRPAPDREPAAPEVLECALCLYANLDDNMLAKDRRFGFSPEIVEAAYPLRSRGLCGTIASLIEASGGRAPYRARELYDSILEHQQKRGTIQAAGFSTVNLPGVLGNVANKILLEAFTKVDATYDKIADQADFSNFHIHSIYRLEATGDFAQVKPDGELAHGTLEQDYYTNQLATYGRMLTLTRQDIINDDLNAFRSLTAQLARRARIAVEKALYALVSEASDVFYTAGHGNRLTSNGLGIAALAAAEAAQYSMTDVNGDPIYAVSRWLVVPPALKFLAEQIYSSQLVNDLSGGPKPTDNPFRGRFSPISSPYLSNPQTPGYSATTWYLLADPLMLPAFQVAYLDGRRAPTIETADALFNVLGLQMRAYWDFGVAQIDYRGAIKSTA